MLLHFPYAAVGKPSSVPTTQNLPVNNHLRHEDSRKCITRLISDPPRLDPCHLVGHGHEIILGIQPDEPPPEIHPAVTPAQGDLAALLDIEVIGPLVVHEERRLQTPEIAHHGFDGIVQDGQRGDFGSFPGGRLFGFGLLDGVFEVGAFAVEFGAEVVEHLLHFFRG